MNNSDSQHETINKLLLELHNKPTDIYEEQRELKNQLALERQTQVEIEEFQATKESLQTVIFQQHETRDNLLSQFHELITKQRKDVEVINVELMDYLQQKEQMNSSHPAYSKIIKLLEEIIVSRQRSIYDLHESISMLEDQIVKLETNVSIPNEVDNLDLSLTDIFSNANDEVTKLRKSVASVLEYKSDNEQYISVLKQKVANYALMVEALKNNPASASFETLAQIFELIVKEHTYVVEDYLGTIDEMVTSLPKLESDIADAVQKQIDISSQIVRTTKGTREVNALIRDQNIVEDLINGSMGKYIEGDIPFINYLNSRSELAVFDIKYVSEELLAGKVKDRGVAELIKMLAQEHNIVMKYKDAFLLRLLFIEHHKVLELSTKNKKLDYIKNYLNPYKSLSDKAMAVGAFISPPLRNPNELKKLMVNLLEKNSGENNYTKDALLELLDNQINRLPKKTSL